MWFWRQTCFGLFLFEVFFLRRFIWRLNLAGNKNCVFSFEICGFCVLGCLSAWFLFCLLIHTCMCISRFIFTSAEHRWLKAARAARAGSRVVPGLLGRRFGAAGGCQSSPCAAAWGLPGPPDHSRGCPWAASGVLVGRFWAAGGRQGLLWAAAWRPPGLPKSYILLYIHIRMYNQVSCDSPPTSGSCYKQRVFRYFSYTNLYPSIYTHTHV